MVAGLCPPRPKDPGTTGVASKTQLDYYHDPAYADYPVLLYTPEEAAAYCSCMGRRLPTEAEFERAAGGTRRAPTRGATCSIAITRATWAARRTRPMS